MSLRPYLVFLLAVLPQDHAAELRRKVAAYFESHQERRVYLQVDRPLYRPGETIHVRVWDLSARDLAQGSAEATLDLVSPRGSVVMQKRIEVRRGLLGTDLSLPASSPGGEYQLRAHTAQGGEGERQVIVAGFEAPRIQKKLEFSRKAYGPGDEASAEVELARASGEPLAGRAIKGAIRIDGRDLPPALATTDATGKAVLRFRLPEDVESGDGLLTVLVEDGGVTESIGRRIPIVVRKISLALLPEGGDLVQGLPSRVYFEARDALGKPADVEGRIVDDLGNTAAVFRSLRSGLGRFQLTPATGRSYRAEIKSPAGIGERFALPVAAEDGCVLRTGDDVEGADPATAVTVRCSAARKVIVTGLLRENVLDAADVEVPQGGEAVVRLTATGSALARAMGVARVTVLSESFEPLAERLVFRNRGRSLRVDIQPDRRTYLPRDEVRLAVRTTDSEGNPVPADLALSVVDETVLSYADDRAADLMARALLEPEIPGTVEDASSYFDRGQKDSAAALDLLLGTRGYRRFEWGPVLSPPVYRYRMEKMAAAGAMALDMDEEPKEEMAPVAKVRALRQPVVDGKPVEPVRSDFRDTVFWAPQVRTSGSGRGEVVFQLSDALTAFRVVAEGMGGGALGRGQARLISAKPLSLEVKLPLEASRGDRILLPVTIASDIGDPMDVTLDASFGPKLSAAEMPGPVHLGPHERATRYLAVDVLGASGRARLHLSARAGALSDALERELPLTPEGFPQAQARSGELEVADVEDVSVAGALPGSVHGVLSVYPSPVSTMMAGLDGMLQEPGGCFEQTSSTNYPNVMILQYLKSHGIVDAAVEQKATRFLQNGYQRLTGFEAPHKGYEWFGGDPGHEALTAYGLTEFADMKGVFPQVDESMVARTAAWLRGRRDGKGGYRRDGKALDSFGRASPQVTDAYITHALLEAGYGDMPVEVTAQEELSRRTSDAYLLALATDTLLRAPGQAAEGRAAAERLAAMQDPSGAFTHEDHSITRSTGTNLQIETTSLAATALLRAGGHEESVRRAINWITSQRSAFGSYGTTQATVLALKAVVAYEESSRRSAAPGTVIIRVGGREVARQSYQAGRREPLTIDVPLADERSRVEVLHEGPGRLPFTLAVTYRTARPVADAASVVELSTHLEKNELHMGEAVRLSAVVSNRTASGQPMALARIGLPAGLSPQTWQLEELRHKGVVAFFETRPREVVLYFRDLKPSESKTIALELTANVPGTFKAPPSSAYLYYGNDHRTWLPGTEVSIAP